MNPHPLKQREQDLMQFYNYRQLGMTPKQFYCKWQVNHEQMAQICVTRCYIYLDFFKLPSQSHYYVINSCAMNDEFRHEISFF